MSGYRYYDDFSLYFVEEEDAGKALDAIIDIFSTYHLRINEQKTKIYKLPVAFRDSWTDYFASFEFKDRRGTVHARKLNLYFSEAFRLQGEHGGEGVLNYALSRFTPDPSASSGAVRRRLSIPVTVPGDYYLTFTSLLCQALISRSDTAARVLAIVRAYGLANPGREDCRSMLEGTIQAMIRSAGPNRDHELIWALTFAIYFGLDLGATWEVIVESSNPLVVLLALDYLHTPETRKKIPVALRAAPSRWLELVSGPESLYNANWILAYEAVRRKWLTTPTDYIKSDAFFSYLRRNKVAFYINSISMSGSHEDLVDEGLERVGIGVPVQYDSA